jgi:hypothetical protein
MLLYLVVAPHSSDPSQVLQYYQSDMKPLADLDAILHLFSDILSIPKHFARPDLPAKIILHLVLKDEHQIFQRFSQKRQCLPGSQESLKGTRERLSRLCHKVISTGWVTTSKKD